MGPYDSCRLMHINLAGFIKKDKDGNNYFDFEELEHVAYENMRLCDDLVDLELEHVDAIIEHIKSTYTDDNRNELGKGTQDRSVIKACWLWCDLISRCVRPCRPSDGQQRGHGIYREGVQDQDARRASCTGRPS